MSIRFWDEAVRKKGYGDLEGAFASAVGYVEDLIAKGVALGHRSLDKGAAWCLGEALAQIDGMMFSITGRSGSEDPPPPRNVVGESSYARGRPIPELPRARRAEGSGSCGDYDEDEAAAARIDVEEVSGESATPGGLVGVEDLLRKIKDMVTGSLYVDEFVARESAVRKPVVVGLHGPPGTGKTSIAHECACMFKRENMEKKCTWASVSPSNTFSKFQGIAARATKGVFENSKKAIEGEEGAVAFVFIDEFDRLVGSHSQGASDSGTSSQVLSEILMAMENPMYHRLVVFLATNHLGSMDSALRSRVRWFGVPLPGREARMGYIKGECPDISGEDLEVAVSCTEGWSMRQFRDTVRIQWQEMRVRLFMESVDFVRDGDLLVRPRLESDPPTIESTTYTRWQDIPLGERKVEWKVPPQILLGLVCRTPPPVGVMRGCHTPPPSRCTPSPQGSPREEADFMTALQSIHSSASDDGSCSSDSSI